MLIFDCFIFLSPELVVISTSQNIISLDFVATFVFVADDSFRITKALIYENSLHKRGKLLVIDQSPKLAIGFFICKVYERGKHL